MMTMMQAILSSRPHGSPRVLMPLLTILRLVTSRGDLDICDSEDEGRDLNGTGASDQTYDESAAKKAVKVGVEPESQ